MPQLRGPTARSSAALLIPSPAFSPDMSYLKHTDYYISEHKENADYDDTVVAFIIMTISYPENSHC